MIIRIFRATVHPGKEAAFRDFFLNTALPHVKSQPGLISASPGLPRAENPQEFCMVMVWKDVASIQAYAGEDWQSPHIHPDEAELVKTRDLQHYDLAQFITG